jgi:competence protein ComEC
MIIRVETLFYPRSIPKEYQQDKPKRIRVTYSGTVPIKAGDRIRSATRLQPPPGPAIPGGYDFRFDSFFKQIGGVGSLNGPLTILRPPQLTWLQDLWCGLDNMRNSITRRITSAVPGQEGAVGAALITGKRGTINDNSNDILRAAGIYHVISISGLHMAIAAGFAFTTSRLLLLLIPGLVLRNDIRRWSALAGIMGAILYDLFAGSDIATERSMLMSVVFFGAIVAGRRLLSMRNWALAAMLLMIVEPQGVINPGFQMSFAAVAALIALYERKPNLAGFEVNHSYEPKVTDKKEQKSRFQRLLAGALHLCRDIVLTTLVAEVATAPYGLFHFHMVQPYGIVGNAITLPFVSLIVMPAAFIGMILIPFGWDGPIWQLMGFGVHGVLEASRLIASWPMATLVLPGFDACPLLMLTLGLAFLTLWISPLRWFGLIGVMAGVVMIIVGHHHYDVLVGREGRFVAVRGSDQKLHFAGRGINSFSLQHYLRDDGDGRALNDPKLIDKTACTVSSCRLQLGDGRSVTLLTPITAKAREKAKQNQMDAEKIIQRACQTSAIVIVPDSVMKDFRPSEHQCEALLIGPDVIRQQGPLALKRQSDGSFKLIANNSAAYDRPWAPNALKPNILATDLEQVRGRNTQ